MKNELESFDGKDNRREIMILLQRLGSDAARAAFLEGLVAHSPRGFAGLPARIVGNCDVIGAYFILVSICNEVGVSINRAVRMLDEEVRKGKGCGHH